MPERDVHDDELLAAGAVDALLDAHLQGLEPALGVAGEREQLRDRGQARWQGHDLHARRTPADGHERGAIPEAGAGHPGDCIGAHQRSGRGRA